MSWKLKERARKVLAREEGHVIKPWGGRVSIALCYPNRYHVGMSNLGFQQMYHLLNLRNDALCERVFLPERPETAEYERTGTPLFSLESQKGLNEFDIVAFSIPFETDYPNVLKMLELGRLPLRSAERGRGPLVIAGGVTAFLNPEPMSDFIDAFLIGEGEEFVDELIDICRREGNDKDRLLSGLAGLRGVYIPSRYDVEYNPDGTRARVSPVGGAPARVERRWVQEIDRYPTVTRIMTPDTEFSMMRLMEISRGCGRGCRFCTAGFVYLPPRTRNPKELLKTEEDLTKSEKVGLVSAAVSDYPFLDYICGSLIKSGKRISVSSLRMDSTTEGLVEALKESGHKTMTFAPEAGTERLRNVINKGISEDDIMGSVEMAVSRGIMNAKFYFLVGLPSETMEDIEGIISLARRIRHDVLGLSREKGRIGTLTISINPFVPKPWTPFQWCGMEEISSIERKLRFIKESLRGEGNMEVIHENPKESYLQAFLSRGDRNAGSAIAAMMKGERLKVSAETDNCVYRERGRDEILPWDFIDHGIKKDYLWREYQDGLKGKIMPPCNPPKCHRCGVC